MGQTSIEWTNKTWNPTRGCSRVSSGCINCYAETMAARLSANGAKPDSPFHGFVTKVNGHAAWTGKVELIEHMLDRPLYWRKPQRIFVNSMSDLFHEELPDEAIDRVFAVMALCPHLTFQILTKRPERMLRWFAKPSGFSFTWREGYIHNAAYEFKPNVRFALKVWPLPNVHLGVSVEDQKTADERIPLLLQTPAAKRFVSYEPALGPVDFARLGLRSCLPYSGEIFHNCLTGFGLKPSPLTGVPIEAYSDRLDQIIVGGESGPGARPFDIQWARQTVAQCKAAGVKVFVKQLGAQPYEEVTREDITPHPVYGDEVVRYTEPVDLKLKDRKGGEMSEWPEDLRIRELI